MTKSHANSRSASYENRFNRRQFLGVSAAAAAAVLFPAPALIARGANDRISVGGIGCGWRGGDHMNAFGSIPGCQVTAIADPDSQHLESFGTRNPKAAKYRDLRKLIEDKTVDVVYVATCNHWHCLAAIWAMEAGKDVYVEKPLSHSQWEGLQVVKAARKYDRICQMGTQQRSDPMQAEIKKFLYEEKGIGTIKSAAVNRYGVRPSIGKRTTPLPIPPEVDYNLWLGPAQDQTLFREKFHYDWHWDWNTGSGEMGNWGVHVMDDMINNVLLDAVALPQRIMAGGARVVYNDAGQTPNVHFVYFDTGLIPVVLGLSNIPDKKNPRSAGKCAGPGSGYVAYAEGGRLEGQRGRAKAFDNDGKLIREFRGDSGAGHQKNFIAAVRAHDKNLLNTDIELGNTVTGWCNFANIAFRVGKPYRTEDAQPLFGKTEGRWEELIANTTELLAGNDIPMEGSEIRLSPMLTIDEKNQRFVGAGADEANQYVKREYRAPFVVPEIQ